MSEIIKETDGLKENEVDKTEKTQETYDWREEFLRTFLANH